uniref:Uncharacterized protein n=1 Tax=Helianthus annuus TaxID=4232 RepID=A0A251SIQ4_HELAN
MMSLLEIGDARRRPRGKPNTPDCFGYSFRYLDPLNLYLCVITRNRNAINVSILDPIFVLNTFGCTMYSIFKLYNT